MRFLGALFLLILAAGTTDSFAQTKNFTLEQAKKIALEQNLSVVQAENNTSSAQGFVLAAYGSYLPTLSATASWTRSQQQNVGGSGASQVFQGVVIPGVAGGTSLSVANNFSTGLNLNYNLFDGFARGARFGQASSNANATDELFARTKQSIVFQVESGYINVLRNGQLVKVADENLKRDSLQLERITESNRVGALSLADVYRQQSQVAADELSVITAQNDYDKAKADLVALIGLDILQEYDFVDPDISTHIPQEQLDSVATHTKSLTAFSQRALTARPDYLGAGQNLSAAESGVTAARSGYFPSIGLFAGYSLYNDVFSKMSDNKNINWGVNIRWNLFDGFQTNQAMQLAVAAKRNAEIGLMQTERVVNVDIKKALLDLEAAKKQYEVGQKGLQSASQDRRIAEERYNLGAGTLLDLLTANAGLVNAEANVVNASYNFVIAKRNLEYVVGERSY